MTMRPRSSVSSTVSSMSILSDFIMDEGRRTAALFPHFLTVLRMSGISFVKILFGHKFIRPCDNLEMGVFVRTLEVFERVLFNSSVESICDLIS